MSKLRIAPTITLLLGQFITLNASAYYQSPSHCGWYGGIEGIYAKATDTLLTNSLFAVKVADPKILGDFKEEYHREPENSWGGSIFLGYDLPSCKKTYYGLLINYTFFHQHDTDFIKNDARDASDKPVIASAEFIDITDESGAKFSDARSKISYDFDTVDLLATKNKLLCNSHLQVFTGIKYFHLREFLKNNYHFSGDIKDVSDIKNDYHVNFSNKSSGVGPELGGQASYFICNGLSLSAHLAGSLLFSESFSQFQNRYLLTPSSTLGDETNLTSKNSHKDTGRVIPALMGKVGIGYQARLRNCSYLEIEAGYRGEKYFHAADDVAYQQLLAGDDINSNSNYQDFDLSGPYVSITIHS